MKYLSVCSGIEAASAAWMPLGWTPVAFSEIEPFPSSVLAHHHPEVPNWGDMTKFEEWPDEPIDLLCGGTPCQSFSVAGLRKGLADPRGNLMLTFGAIAAKYRPRWMVWENVPGVLSSNGGRDFGSFLGLLGELGYGFAYRVLDAQYFGVAQRRRRVFVVGHLGDWRRAAAVLFERHSLSGHPAPRREARKVAPIIPSRSTAGGGLGTDFDCDGGVIQVCPTLRAGGNRTGGDRPPGTDPTVQKVASLDETAQCLRARTPGNIDNSSTTVVQQPVAFQDTADCLTAAYGTKWNGNASATNGSLFAAQPVAYGIRTANTSSNGWGIQEECTHTIDCAQGIAVAQPAVYAIQAGALRVNPASGPDGVGVQADHAYTLEARAEVQAVAFAENSRAELRLEGGDGSRCGALSTGGGKPGQGVPMIAFHPTQDPISSTDGSTHALGCGSTGGQASVAVALRGREGGAVAELGDEVQNCLRASSGGGDKPHVLTAMQVRRLTPVECERLQGFPDGYTAIPWRKKPADECPDGPRYKALGNSWAVNCARWIGERIEAVETIVALP